MALRKGPHLEEAAKQPSRRTHSADPAEAWRVCVGVVTGPQGVQGAVRIKSFTEIPEDVAGYGPLEDETGRRQFDLHLCGVAKGVLIARLPGIEDRDQAEALRGLRLYLPRSALPQPEAEEYYHADLIGLSAVDRDGSPVGVVTGVENYGAGDLLEIAREDGRTGLIPFKKDIADVNLDRIILDPQYLT